VTLYVKQFGRTTSDRGKPILANPTIAQLRWLHDGRHVTALIKGRHTVVLVSIDVDSGRQELIARSATDIREYSIDEAGNVVVFAVDEAYGAVDGLVTGRDAARGFLVPFQESGTILSPHGRLYLTMRRHNHLWTTPDKVTISSPITGKPVNTFAYYDNFHLSLSPNGQRLLFTYRSGEIPERWKTSPVVKDIVSSGSQIMLTVLQDLTGRTPPLLVDAPLFYNIPLWSPDSQSFAFSAVSPIGSVWEHQDIEEHRRFGSAVHLFAMDIGTRAIQEITRRMADIGHQPLFWNEDGRLLLQTDEKTFSEFARQNGKWLPVRSLDVPFTGFFAFSQMSSDGESILGDYQDARTPPELFAYDLANKSVRIIEKLNPQFDDIGLSPYQTISWTMPDGYEMDGILFVPGDFKRDTRYPLVIQTKPYDGGFVCDYGEADYPSFAPQPIASAGMLYLARTFPSGWKQSDDAAHYPEGYPGQLSEAAFQAKMWDSAVDALDKRGIIDREKVGIIGFSRSGWYTEFALAHGETHYSAATATDNVQYSLNEYWLLHTNAVLRGWDSMYGGPPNGATLNNWIQYSVPFTLPRFHTPLLMEVMGYGLPYKNKLAPPALLADHFDVLVGLSRLNKPVELYYYPDEKHQMEHPQARLGSIQRNLDWYRFWLQGYERPMPEDPKQYLRWHLLREMQNAASASK
jgi:dipeptidyl aminopeptidase/acylaminoacyl peptidase